MPSTYEINQPPKEPQVAGHEKFVRTGLAVSGILAAAIMVILFITDHRLASASNAQATQIHQLYQANSRLAGQLSAQSTQLSQLSARLAAADPAADTNLVTCRDLKSMALVATNGGSVSAVPGSVSLSQSAVPMPGHCRK